MIPGWLVCETPRQKFSQTGWFGWRPPGLLHQAGIKEYLVKPVKPENLSNKIKEVVFGGVG